MALYLEYSFNKIVDAEIKKNMKNLKDIANQLNIDFKNIEGYKVTQVDDKVTGGFYWTSYKCTVTGDIITYPIHETFGRLTEKIQTFDELYSYLKSRVKDQLENQKYFDELYAKDYGLPVIYKFNYLT